MYIQWRREWTAPTVVGVISFGIGVGVGYGFSVFQRNKNFKHAMISLGSQEKVLEYVEGLMNSEEPITDFSTPHVIEEYGIVITERVDEEQISELTATDLNYSDLPEIEKEKVNVFPEPEPNWSYEEEMKHRSEDKPYIIHRNEYDGEEKGYGQSTLTYYAGDDILTDEDDVPIHNMIQIVGTDNLIFGKGSEDPSLVYIRNDKLEAEYEIILDHGLFQVEVLGQEIEDKLSTERSFVPKFRQE